MLEGVTSEWDFGRLGKPQCEEAGQGGDRNAGRERQPDTPAHLRNIGSRRKKRMAGG
jgi:hypothetical protein